MFLEKKIKGIVSRVLVEKLVPCHICGKQLDDATSYDRYQYYIHDGRSVVKQFYSNISITRYSYEIENRIIQGTVYENLITGEIFATGFNHLYLHAKKDNVKNYDNINFIGTILQGLKEEQQEKFLEDLCLDSVVSLLKPITRYSLKTQKSMLDIDSYKKNIRSSKIDKLKLTVEKINENNFTVIDNVSPNWISVSGKPFFKYKHRMLKIITDTILSWSKNWAETHYNKIKRPCVTCYTKLAFEKSKQADSIDLKEIDQWKNMTLQEKLEYTKKNWNIS